jgi:hypothetical protein
MLIDAEPACSVARRSSSPGCESTKRGAPKAGASRTGTAVTVARSASSVPLRTSRATRPPSSTFVHSTSKTPGDTARIAGSRFSPKPKVSTRRGPDAGAPEESRKRAITGAASDPAPASPTQATSALPAPSTATFGCRRHPAISGLTRLASPTAVPSTRKRREKMRVPPPGTADGHTANTRWPASMARFARVRQSRSEATIAGPAAFPCASKARNLEQPASVHCASTQPASLHTTRDPARQAAASFTRVRAPMGLPPESTRWRKRSPGESQEAPLQSTTRFATRPLPSVQLVHHCFGGSARSPTPYSLPKGAASAATTGLASNTTPATRPKSIPVPTRTARRPREVTSMEQCMRASRRRNFADYRTRPEAELAGKSRTNGKAAGAATATSGFVAARASSASGSDRMPVQQRLLVFSFGYLWAQIWVDMGIYGCRFGADP